MREKSSSAQRSFPVSSFPENLVALGFGRGARAMRQRENAFLPSVVVIIFIWIFCLFKISFIDVLYTRLDIYWVFPLDTMLFCCWATPPFYFLWTGQFQGAVRERSWADFLFRLIPVQQTVWVNCSYVGRSDCGGIFICCGCSCLYQCVFGCEKLSLDRAMGRYYGVITSQSWVSVSSRIIIPSIFFNLHDL